MTCLIKILPVTLPEGWKPTFGLGNLALGQINTSAGDIWGNVSKIQTAYQQACEYAVDMVVFPELSAMGYPIGDIITRYPALVQQQLAAINEFAQTTTETTAALVGFVEPVMGLSPTARQPYYNSVAMCQGGRVQGVIRKHLLPAYHEYYDHRTFRSAPTTSIESWQYGVEAVEQDEPWNGMVGGHYYGVAICYDWWYQSENNPRQLNPVSQWLGRYPKTEVLINCSASPSRRGKQSIRQTLFDSLVAVYGRPLVYANTVGAIDEHSYDGASIVMSASGQLIARGPSFKEALILANPLTGVGVIERTPEVVISGASFSGTLLPEPVFDPTHTDDLERTYYSVVQGIRDYFKKCGFKRAVLGLSGGLDSSVTAALAVAALGAKQVLGVAMPSELSAVTSQSDAYELATRLGMLCVDVPIVHMADSAQNTLQQLQQADTIKQSWGDPSEHSFASDNMQAMSRATLLRLLGNEYGAFPLATSDKSELYMGYTTVNGDMSGALAPMADIPKTKVRALAGWFNSQPDGVTFPWSHHEPIPVAVIEKPSGAELAINPKTGQVLTAEEALMPYEFSDEIIWRLEQGHQSKADMLEVPFTYEKSHELSREQKQAWLDIFFTRMSRSVFKWYIAPPTIIVEGAGSIAKSDYRHPITANQIDW